MTGAILAGIIVGLMLSAWAVGSVWLWLKFGGWLDARLARRVAELSAAKERPQSDAGKETR